MIVAAYASGRQKIWLEASQRRVGATAAMLSDIRGMKMTGLSSQLSENINKLRMEEIRLSKVYRRLLVTVVSLCKRVLSIDSAIFRELTSKH